MHRMLQTGLLSLLVLGSLMSADIHASQIPLGIDARQLVFVQEYWKDGEPGYCIANAGNKDTVVQVSRWRSRQLPSVPLRAWPVPAGEVRCHEAGFLLGEWLLEFKKVDGPRLGLLRAPMKRPAGLTAHSPVASYQGLNGSCRDREVWLEQDRLWLDPQGGAKLRLHLPADTGPVTFSPDAADWRLPPLPIAAAASDTLPVQVEGKRVSIGEAGPGTKKGPHWVRLSVAPVQVDRPSMFLLAGQRVIRGQGTQCFVRGVLVAPRRAE